MTNLDTDHTYVGGMVCLNLGDWNAHYDQKFHSFVVYINCWRPPVLWLYLVRLLWFYMTSHCEKWSCYTRVNLHVWYRTVRASLVSKVGVTMKLLRSYSYALFANGYYHNNNKSSINIRVIYVHIYLVTIFLSKL